MGGAKKEEEVKEEEGIEWDKLKRSNLICKAIGKRRIIKKRNPTNPTQ